MLYFYRYLCYIFIVQCKVNSLAEQRRVRQLLRFLDRKMWKLDSTREKETFRHGTLFIVAAKYKVRKFIELFTTLFLTVCFSNTHAAYSMFNSDCNCIAVSYWKGLGTLYVQFLKHCMMCADWKATNNLSRCTVGFYWSVIFTSH